MNLAAQRDQSANYQAALDFAKEKKWDEAITKFSIVLNAEPKNTKALYNRSLVFTRMHDYLRASKDILTLEAIDPEFPYINLLKGTIFLQIGDWPTAEDALAKQIMKYPSDFEAYYLEGLVLALEEDYKCALTRFQKSISLNDKYARAWHDMASVYYRMENMDSALICYQKALELKPYEGQFAGNVAVSLLTDGLPEMAFAALETARENDSNQYIHQINSGVAAYLTEDYENANSFFTRAIEIEPSNPVGWLNLGVNEIKRNNISDAQKFLLKCTELNPGNGIAWLNLGIAYDQAMQFEKACTCFYKASQLGAPKAERYYINQCPVTAN